MSMRRRLLALAGVIALAGAAVAQKPPGLPVNPLVENREPNPVAREFHESDDRPPALGSVAVEVTRLPERVSLAALVAGFGEVLLSRLTIPLGVVSVGD